MPNTRNVSSAPGTAVTSATSVAPRSAIIQKEIYNVGDRVKFGSDTFGTDEKYPGRIISRQLPARGITYIVEMDSQYGWPYGPITIQSDEISGQLTTGGKRKRQTKGQRRRRRPTRRR